MMSICFYNDVLRVIVKNWKCRVSSFKKQQAYKMFKISYSLIFIMFFAKSSVNQFPTIASFQS